MLTYYGSSISKNITETPEGYLIARNVPIARTGMQEYLARELGLDGDGERIVKVYRHPEDVFDRAAIASFEGKPLTDEHPPEGVDASNHAAYSKGHLQNVRREDERLVADLVIADPALVSEVKNAVKREVSCGYDCDYVPDGEGYKQINIRGNHVAVVHRGRAGHDVAIKDSAPARKGKRTMTLAELFGLKVETVATQDAEPVEMTPDAKPAAETTAEPAPALDACKDEEVPKGDDLGSKLDKLIERIDTIEKRLNGHGGKEDEPSDEKTLDEELTKLAGEEADEEPSEVIEAEETEMEDACGSKDAAISILKAVRPAVAAISDAKQKAAVVDALISSIRGTDNLSAIQSAARDSAIKAHEAAGKTDYDKMCEAQASAYAARNPHMKKEG